jgi:hypothetical protein
MVVAENLRTNSKHDGDLSHRLDAWLDMISGFVNYATRTTLKLFANKLMSRTGDRFEDRYYNDRRVVRCQK